MKPFQHFIITRFNLKNETWLVDKNKHQVLDESWLKKRYQLFDRFCYSSMINQSEKNFTWLVYFDSDTPDFYKKKNKSYSARFVSFKAIYKDSFTHFVKDLKADITCFLKPNTTHIITSRLDNDDAFHEDVIKIIQKQFNYQNSSIVDLQKGLCLQIAPNYRLFEANIISGPFLSLIEKRVAGDFNTVISRAHKDWRDNLELIEMNSQPLWLQVIHKNNLANTLIGSLIAINNNLEGFHIKRVLILAMNLRLSYFRLKLKTLLKNIMNR